ncbi:MAG: energy-coupling factor transporter transmembrane component T [Actinomycetaceae bacterium]|nr:energy-coupling factor transporter transmembrane component T [Actinomycetaceae bacterium]
MAQEITQQQRRHKDLGIPAIFDQSAVGTSSWRTRWARRLDPRTLFALMLTLNIFGLGQSSQLLVMLCLVITAVFMLVSVKMKMFIGWFTFVLINIGIFYVLPGLWPNGFVFAITFIAFWFFRFSISMGIAIAVFSVLDVQKVSAVLTRMKAPAWFYVPTLVIIRFFPVAIAELRAINNAMILRDLKPGGWGMMRHPIRVGEYVLIPFLASAARIADELAAASIIKGLGARKQTTTIVHTAFFWGDALVLVVIICLIAMRISEVFL